MERRLAHRGGALLAAVAVGGGLLPLTGLPLLAAAAGACWGVGVAVAGRAHRLRPTVHNDDGWTDARWTGLAVGLVTLAAVVGVPASLPLSAGRRFGLSVLVLGVGVVAYGAGTMAEVERHPEGPVRGTDSSEATSSLPPDRRRR